MDGVPPQWYIGNNTPPGYASEVQIDQFFLDLPLTFTTHHAAAVIAVLVLAYTTSSAQSSPGEQRPAAGVRPVGVSTGEVRQIPAMMRQPTAGTDVPPVATGIGLSFTVDQVPDHRMLRVRLETQSDTEFTLDLLRASDSVVVYTSHHIVRPGRHSMTVPQARCGAGTWIVRLMSEGTASTKTITITP